MSNLEEQQNWYVRLPYSNTIQTVRILQLDNLIIHLEPISKRCGFWQPSLMGGGVNILKIDDVEFIQRVENQQERKDD